jgi:hypothetical protein
MGLLQPLRGFAMTINVMNDYSTKRISGDLMDEIIEALQSVRGWGSVEIMVQDYNVVQITVRNIKKTNIKQTTSSSSKTV